MQTEEEVARRLCLNLGIDPDESMLVAEPQQAFFPGGLASQPKPRPQWSLHLHEARRILQSTPRPSTLLFR